MTIRTCKTEGCGRELGAANKSGICSTCQSGYQPKDRPGSASAKHALPPPARASTRDADDELLDRTAVKPPPPAKAKKPKEPEAEPGPIEEFFKLTDALGLDGQKMLDDWCVQWVAKMRARALGSRPSADAPAELQAAPAEAPEP